MSDTKPRPVDTLYDLSISVTTKHYKCFENELSILPGTILFDVFYSLYKNKMICRLFVELLDVDRFGRILQVTEKRTQLLKLFQALMDHDMSMADSLKQAYVEKCQYVQQKPSLWESNIILGLRLGTFLSDAGWYVESKGVLQSCLALCLASEQTPAALRRTLECYHKLLHANAEYRDFRGAADCYHKALALRDKLRDLNELPNLAALYAEFSAHFSVRYEYDKAYQWGLKAVQQLVPGLPISVVIVVLRRVARICVIKRQLRKAQIIIQQAISLACQDCKEEDDPRFADALVDYSFFLLNSDQIKRSVATYLDALKIKQNLFGKMNLHVAILLEDLAYALYVSEYKTGHFREARNIAEHSNDILRQLLPADHLLHGSAKRVKALILEEISLDNPNESILPAVEELHFESLKLSMQSFGVWNVQISKHYGNLGRLYQSMHKYKAAEKMHLKSIHIKEHLLGVDDYEVGLSAGHLASLYTYQTHEYRKAEKLYLRSIDISKKVYGPRYSGLEFDYRGLLHIYNKLEEYEKLAEYSAKREEWKRLQDEVGAEDYSVNLQEKPLPLPEIIKSFFSD